MPTRSVMGRRQGVTFAGASFITLIAACPACSASPGQGFALHTLSSRPEAVSGGDVLVAIAAPVHARWIARLDGRDVTGAFRPGARTGTLLALLKGLKAGENTLEMQAGGMRSRLELMNHPLAGPVFSGPHQEPFICETVANGLGPAQDADCTAKTLVQYYYKSTQPVQQSALDAIAAIADAKPGSLPPGFKAYDLSGPPPTDLAQTQTSDGRMVNYIVRREIGTINRAVYDIRFLHEPGQPLPTPWTEPTPGWNGRLVYEFGGGCGPGNHQGTLVHGAGAEREALLASGYAVATSTLNIFQNSCNDRLSAETLSMVKEHFIKSFGVPRHTLGLGGSGGSVQLHLTAQNYPGLLDGIIPYISYPDQMSPAHTAAVTDCALLDHAFNGSQKSWSEEQKTAVSGFVTWRTCAARAADNNHLEPQHCISSIPTDALYDPIANRQGVRCDLYDNEINVLGRDSATGFAHRPLDNVGVQYGLAAFNAGKIDVEQFVELNERIGGYDQDGRIVTTRTEADPESLRIAYQHGLILTGGGDLGRIPIIDWRPYWDDLGDIHVRFESFVTRARLERANGNADNQVILVDPRMDLLIFANPDPATSPVALRLRDLVRQMDHWLDNISADGAAGTVAARVSRNRPSDLADGCRATDGQPMVEPATVDGPGRCNQLYPSGGDPRIVAGAPLTDDMAKCALKPMRDADYAHRLTADQMQRLRVIFPAGVCDYSRPGVEQQTAMTPWQRYGGERAPP